MRELRRWAWMVLMAAAIVGCGRSTPKPLSAPLPPPLPGTIAEAKSSLAGGHKDIYEAALRTISMRNGNAEALPARVSLARFLDEEKRFAESAAEYRAAARAAPDLAPFLLLGAARANLASGDLARATATAESIIAGAPGSTAKDDANLLLALIAAHGGDRARVEAALQKTSGVEIDGFTEGELAGLARALETAGMPDLATRVWMRMLFDDPGGRLTEEAYGAVAKADGGFSPLDRLGYDESLRLAEALGRADRFDQALDLYDRISSHFPTRAAQPAFRYSRVSAYFRSRHYAEVVATPADDDSPYALSLELLRARAYWRLHQDAEFVRRAERIIADAPESKAARESRILLAKYYMIDQPDHARAAALLERLIAEGGAGRDGENLWTLGWLWVESGNDERALETLDAYLRQYPDADYTSNALFWSAKVLGRIGRSDESAARFRRLISTYPYGYYSDRARQIIGASPASGEVAGAPPFPDVSRPPAPEIAARLGLVERLRSIDFVSDASRQVRQIASGQKDDPAIWFDLADLLSRSGERLQAIGILQAHFRGVIRHGATGVPERFWEILFPLPYWDEIVGAAGRAKVDPWLIPAIIRQESGFDPSVVSNAGAVGIMQIMPAEASRIATRAGLGESVARSDLFDVCRNIEIGAAELAQKLEAMQGNEVYAIAAYNAGEDAVSRWIAQTPSQDIDTFIESIPFNETRLYVKDVVRNRSEYLRIYGNASAASSSQGPSNGAAGVWPAARKPSR
jgi:soluble lytic murein transglycosylase